MIKLWPIAFAVPVSLLLLLFVTVRWSGSNVDGPVPPLYGFPLPWTCWNGVSSLEWVISPHAFLFDWLVYFAPVYGVALAIASRVQVPEGRTWIGLLLGAIALNVGAFALLTLTDVIPLAIGLHELGPMPSTSGRTKSLFVGSHESV